MANKKNIFFGAFILCLTVLLSSSIYYSTTVSAADNILLDDACHGACAELNTDFQACVNECNAKCTSCLNEIEPDYECVDNCAACIIKGKTWQDSKCIGANKKEPNWPIPKCYSSADCGVNHWSGGPYCDSENPNEVHRTWVWYFCRPDYHYCETYYTEKTIEVCRTNYCESWAYYCKNNDVYHGRICHSAGCSSGACYDYSNLEEEKLQECDTSATSGCSNAGCNIIIKETQDLITHFYQKALGRSPGPSEIDAWEQGYFDYANNFDIDIRLAAGEMGRQLFFSEEYKNRNRTNEQFIKDCYSAFLMRDPSQDELNGWLNSGWNWNKIKAITIFAGSNEFEGIIKRLFPNMEGNPTHNFIAIMYIGVFDRLVDESGLNAWADLLNKKHDTGTIQYMAHTLFNSAEYLSKSPTNEDRVIRLYRAFMDRYPSDNEINYWANELNSGSKTFDQVIEFFANSPEFTERLNRFFKINLEASWNDNPFYPISYAIDGNPGTYYMACSYPSRIYNNGWILYTLSEAKNIETIIFDFNQWHADYPGTAPSYYKVYVSSDKYAWTQVYERNGPANRADDVTITLNSNIRYIKLEYTKINDGTGWCLALNEITIT